MGDVWTNSHQLRDKTARLCCICNSREYASKRYGRSVLKEGRKQCCRIWETRHVLAHHVDVVLKLRADGNHGRAVRDRALHELDNRVVLVRRGVFLYQVDFVLQDDDVFQAHDFHGGEVFARLGLRAAFVSRDEQKRAIHHRGAVEHGGHQNVVPGAIHEGNVPHEVHLFILKPGDFAVGTVRVRASVGAVATRPDCKKINVSPVCAISRRNVVFGKGPYLGHVSSAHL